MQNDVTAGYIVTDVERLRKPMQMITDYLQKKMGISVEKPAKKSKKLKNRITNEHA